MWPSVIKQTVSNNQYAKKKWLMSLYHSAHGREIGSLKVVILIALTSLKFVQGLPKVPLTRLAHNMRKR